MTTNKPILTLSNKSNELRQKALRDKWMILMEKITDNAMEIAKQGKDPKNYVEAIGMLNEMISNS
jgi:hypothetical protein